MHCSLGLPAGVILRDMYSEQRSVSPEQQLLWSSDSVIDSALLCCTSSTEQMFLLINTIRIFNIVHMHTTCGVNTV